MPPAKRGRFFTPALPPRRRVPERWLGGLDSNQGSMLQRHVSYHWTTSQDIDSLGH